MSNVKSASRVVDVLELLASHKEGLSVTDVSGYLRIPPSSCHTLLQTLTRRGWLTREERNKRYRLGLKLFQLVGCMVDSLDIVEVAEPVMERVNQLCNQAVSLATLEGTEVVVIYKKTASGVIRIVNPVGTRLPAHATALGKVILAELSEEQVDYLYPDEELEAHTPFTITTKQELKQCLSQMEETGIAYDREESSMGIQAVGSVIKNYSGLPVAAISIAVLSADRHDEKYWGQLEKLVRVAAAVISARLGNGSELVERYDISALDRAWESGLEFAVSGGKE